MAGSAACLIAVLSASGQAPTTRATPNRCDRYQLGAATPLLDAQRRRIHIEEVAPVQTGKEITLFGTSTLLWFSERIYADTAGMIAEAKAGRYVSRDTLGGAVLGADGVARTFGKPPGVTAMSALVAAADGNDGAWVAWTLPAESGRSITTVWVARFTKGSWSRAEPALHVTSLISYSLSIATARGGTPVLSVEASDTTTRRYGIAVVRRVGTGWATAWLSTSNVPSFDVRLVSLGGDALALAYMGWLRLDAATVDSNSVFIAQSQDGGHTWSPFSRIARNWNYSPNWLHLSAPSADKLNAFWVRAATGSRDEGAVHYTTDDGGRHWTEQHRVQHGSLKSLTFTASERGALYILKDHVSDRYALVDLRSNDMPATMHVPWQQAALPPRAATFGDPRGLYFVTYGALVNDAYPLFPGLAVPSLHYAWIQPCAQ